MIYIDKEKLWLIKAICKKGFSGNLSILPGTGSPQSLTAYCFDCCSAFENETETD